MRLLALGKFLKQGYPMKSLRAVIAAPLLGVFCLGQLTPTRCPMLTNPAESPDHQLHHGLTAPDDGVAAPELPDSDTTQMPMDCLMPVNCGSPGFPIVPIALEMLPTERTVPRAVLSIAHIDPLILAITPPPRG